MSRYKAMQIGVDEEYIEYTSPSIILGQLSKGDAIPQWSANQTTEYIKNNSSIDMVNSYQKGCYVLNPNILNEARFAWKNRRTQTADIGTELHRLIETWINYKFEKEIQPMALQPHPYEFSLYYDV